MNRNLAWPAAAVAALVLVGSPAFAAGWSPPADPLRIVLPFGAQYAGRTHHGVDVAATAGGEAMAPTSGTVTFAGSVPADGGGTCFAVTVLTADGLKVTLLPLQSAFVSAGSAVNAGEAVGLIAEDGDDSSAEPHVHLSVRRGDAYLDPAPFLPMGPSPTSAAAPAESTASFDDACGAGPSVASAVASVAGPTELAPGAHSTPVTEAAAAPMAAASPSSRVASSSRQVLADGGAPEPCSLKPDLHFVPKRTRLSLTSANPTLAGAAIAAVALAGVAAVACTRHAAERV